MNKNRTTALLLICALAAAGCGSRAQETLAALEKDRFLVRTERAQVRPLEEYILLTGSVRALDEATLYPRAAGKLLRNLLKEGDPVKRDEAVALVERDEVGVVYEPAPVPSTLTGVIGRVYQDTGATVTPQTPIALVVDQSKVRVEIDVPERYIARISRGQAARIAVDAFPDRNFAGRVHRVSPVVDPRSRNAAVEVLIDNAEGRLKSGMFASARLIMASRGAALSVPAGALVEEGGKTYLFVPGPEGVARRVEVRVGIRTAEYAQVDGVKEGQEIITFGLYGLRDGSKIQALDR